MMSRKILIWSLVILGPLLLGGLIAYLAITRMPGTRGTGSEPLPVLGVVPEFVLTDSGANPLGLNDLLGKAWVVNFVFTRCAATCPAQSSNLAALQAKLDGSPNKDRVRLVSITVDPEYDTADVLKTYAATHGARPGYWHFLGGPIDDVLSLSREGFKLAADRRGKDAAGPAHSQQFVLVDPWGQIRGYYEGVSSASVESLARDLGRVLAERSPSMTPLAESAALRDPNQKLDKVLQDKSWLREWQQEQIQQAKDWKVFHDFTFTDRRYDSGITFRHRVVDDAAGRYKANHYDHGNGVIAADVDGDGSIDLYFVNQVGECQLWRNKGSGKFENITAQAGVGLPELIKVTASFADLNNDGAPDLYITTIRGGNRLFLNDGKGTFTDMTERSRLGLVGHFSSPVFFDYDRDGLLDLFLCDVGVFTTDTKYPVTTPTWPESPLPGVEYYEAYTDAFSGHLKPERAGKCRLFRNLGDGRFADVTKDMGLDGHVGWAGDATPVDGNADGWPDLYVLNMQGNDEYYENQGGKRFERKTQQYFPKTPWGSMGAKVFDANNDGRLDLFVTDMHSDMCVILKPDRPAEKRKSEMTWPESFLTTKGASVFGNALYENRGKSEFREVSDAIGVEMYWPWGPSVGDLNADGLQDLFITAGMSYPYRYGINSLLLNDGGRFRDSEFVVGVEPRRGWRTAMPWFARQDDAINAPREKRVTVWSSLSSRSSILVDLDNDGDLDIVTNEFNAEPMLLISNLSEKKRLHFLKVQLIGSMTANSKSTPLASSTVPGPKSNRDGLGALVRVRCGAREFVQVRDGKDGYLSQGLIPLYFGLGEADAADSVEVVWPSGKKQTVPGPLKANTVVTVREQ